jgi:hypothetical protein
LKPEWWGSPLAQEHKYQEERKPVTRNDDDDDDDDNNNNNNKLTNSISVFPTLSVNCMDWDVCLH